MLSNVRNIREQVRALTRVQLYDIYTALCAQNNSHTQLYELSDIYESLRAGGKYIARERFRKWVFNAAFLRRS